MLLRKDTVKYAALDLVKLDQINNEKLREKISVTSIQFYTFWPSFVIALH
jgi:hypothetical protein